MGDCGHIESVSCSWHTVQLISRGFCYVSDMTSSVCHCLCVPQTVSADDDCSQLSESEWTDSDRCLMQHGDVDATSCCSKLQEHFTSVEANDTSTFAVTSDRNLVSICQEGSSFHVLRLLSGFKIHSVSCGKCHTLVLSAIGVVLSCGLGNQGQLGHGSLDSEHSLRVIEALEGVRMTAVCAGGWHSMALSDSDDAYVWGWNDSGQLGLRCSPAASESEPVISSRHHSLEEVVVSLSYSLTLSRLLNIHIITHLHLHVNGKTKIVTPCHSERS